MSARALAFWLSGLALFSPLATEAQEYTGEKLEAADRAYDETVGKARVTYRKSLAQILGNATKVEVFLLDFEMQDAHVLLVIGWHFLEEDFFPIMPYGNKSKILGRKELTPDEMKKLLPVLQATVGVEENSGGAMCHYPIHGIRVWAADKLLFQSSFCWHCSNFYVPYPERKAEWIGLKGRDLENVMSEVLPIPEKEIARFKRINEPKPKPKKKSK